MNIGIPCMNGLPGKMHGLFAADHQADGVLVKNSLIFIQTPGRGIIIKNYAPRTGSVTRQNILWKIDDVHTPRIYQSFTDLKTGYNRSTPPLRPLPPLHW